MPTARADDCTVVESRASLAAMSGVRITSLEVGSSGPSLPGPTRMFAPLHRASSEGTIRRQLLFAPGDTVDTMLVGETMRRLRRQHLFADAVLEARRCEGTGGVALVLRTRDSWTLLPTARFRTPSTLSVGLEERNLLGTGRAVAVTSEMSPRGKGAALALSDPWLFGSDVAGTVRIASLAGTHSLRAGLRNHEYSVFDPWRIEGNLARFSYGDTNATERALHTLAAMALVGRRVGAPTNAVTMLLAGIEFDSAATVSSTRRLARASPRAAPLGTPHVRSFLGADVGIARRTAQFDTASWIVPGRGFLDVPLGWEGEGVLGAGYERDARSPALKGDLWLGRLWIPARGRLLSFDGWASGYVGRNVDANHILRLSAAWYEESWRGMWGARVTAERLFELDPDKRALSLMPLTDYTAPAVRPYVVRAGRTLAGSIERSVHLFTVGSASVVDAGPFVAGSYRWQIEELGGGQLRAGVVGTRLRLLSANGAVSSVRVDVGYPVVRSAVLPRRAFVVLTVGTLLDVIRQRDGRRVY